VPIQLPRTGSGYHEFPTAIQNNALSVSDFERFLKIEANCCVGIAKMHELMKRLVAQKVLKAVRNLQASTFPCRFNINHYAENKANISPP
jgi:hypothetical protein